MWLREDRKRTAVLLCQLANDIYMLDEIERLLKSKLSDSDKVESIRQMLEEPMQRPLFL